MLNEAINAAIACPPLAGGLLGGLDPPLPTLDALRTIPSARAVERASADISWKDGRVLDSSPTSLARISSAMIRAVLEDVKKPARKTETTSLHILSLRFCSGASKLPPWDAEFPPKLIGAVPLEGCICALTGQGCSVLEMSAS